MSIRYSLARCSLGDLLVAITDAGVCAILIGDDSRELVDDLERRFPGERIASASEPLDATVTDVRDLIDDPARAAHLPLDMRGTAFQQSVWQALREIPPGTTISYGELALRIGAPNATRAVAGACGANPLAVAVPCHRVVARDGSLAGYRWGVERKRELLKREATAAAHPAAPGAPQANVTA